MYSFLRKPLWILNHILIALLIVVLISLGFWQRARYHQESDKKNHLEAAAAATPVPIDSVVSADVSPQAVPESANYKRVKVTGRFDVEHEVVINNRSFDGAPGGWVLTPLVSEDGTAVAVVRGWVPLSLTEKGVPVNEALPPEQASLGSSGTATVTGVVQLTQVRGSFGPRDQPSGMLDHLSRVDLERMQKQLPYRIEPVWVLLDGQRPPQSSELPRLVSLQPNDPSQNFSYMIQWWTFAAIAIGGYPLVLRMVARNRSEGRTKRRRATIDEIPWAAGLDPQQPSGAVDTDTSSKS